MIRRKETIIVVKICPQINEDLSIHLKSIYSSRYSTAWTVETPAVPSHIPFVRLMAVRLSGNCDVAGRVGDKKHTDTMVGEHKSAHQQAGGLTMSEADRLCENEKEKERLRYLEQWRGIKYSWVQGRP